MVNQVPKIDRRTAQDINHQVQKLLAAYLPEQYKDLGTDKQQLKGMSSALVHIFAHFAEIIIERLNHVPQKNFLAFLDLLGASRLPPQSARVPLTFSLAKGATEDAIVPKGTQVAAQPTGDETEPVIFETAQDLVVTAAQLSSIFVYNPQQEKYDDYSTTITTVASRDLPIFHGKQKIAQLPSKLAIEKAFTNNKVIDLSTDFFPFGQQPKFGDTLYLANSQIFSQHREKITLKVDLTPPANYTNSTQSEVTASNLRLQWEFWNGEIWQLLGESVPNPEHTPHEKNTEFTFTDTTKALTISGLIEFTCPRNLEITKVHNLENHWIRVRIVSGNYKTSTPDNSPTMDSVPPVIHSIGYLLLREEVVPVDKEPKPALYFSFTLPSNRKEFLQRSISLFISLSEPKYDSLKTLVRTSLTDPKQLQLSWQYWNGNNWESLTVSDATDNFTRPGVITFLPPKDFALKEYFGLLLRYWLRVRWESGEYLNEPKLRQVLPNTVMATQTVTIRKEVLGSSDGSKNQRFRTTRTPILKGQHVEIRECDPLLDAHGHPTNEGWVRWHEVPDFYGSGPRDRHYVINHLTGEITFGDGRNGLIPSLSKGNIRMGFYQTGGGKAGNKPVGTIVQLKTTVPYVDRVTNHDAATGGAEEKSIEALIEQIPRQIRHHGRAVTLEDYEDIAKEASDEVARAKCVPLLDLANNPLAVDKADKKTGTVSVIIVPHSTEANPQPTLALMSRVQEYLEARIDPTVNVVVVGPLYVEVKITTELVLTSLESGRFVEQAVEQKLASFLHPITGGMSGTGWDFGRNPHKSDFYVQLEAISGVDYVRSLTLDPDPDDPKTIAENINKVLNTKRFVVYSGKHKITLRF